MAIAGKKLGDRYERRDASQRTGRTAVRRRLYKQLRRAIISHLKHSAKIPVTTLLDTEIQISPWWERGLLGLLGAVVGAGGGAIIAYGGDDGVTGGAVLLAVGAIFLVSACRGRRLTVRGYLNSLREGVERAAEDSIEALVNRSLKNNNALDEISPTAAGEMIGVEMDWTGGAGVGDIVVGGDIGDTAGEVAGGIVDGIF